MLRLMTLKFDSRDPYNKAKSLTHKSHTIVRVIITNCFVSYLSFSLILFYKYFPFNKQNHFIWIISILGWPELDLVLDCKTEAAAEAAAGTKKVSEKVLSQWHGCWSHLLRLGNIYTCQRDSSEETCNKNQLDNVDTRVIIFSENPYHSSNPYLENLGI